MKKQAKLFGFIAFILILFFGFEIYQRMNSNDQMEVEVITDAGDQTHLNEVAFIGSAYNQNSSGNSTTFYYKGADISYYNDLSFFKRLDFEYNPKANHLVTNYRSFMRSKSRQNNLFTETDKHIIYTATEADIDWRNFNSNVLNISVLDKETENEESFEVKLINDINQSHYINVVATYVNYPELTIITSENVSDYYSNRLFVYTVNVEEPEETADAIINLSEEVGSNDSFLNISTSILKTERYIPLQVVQETYGEYGEVEQSSVEYYLYDRENNEVLDVPAFDENPMVIFAEEDKVYIGEDFANTIELYELDVVSQSLDSIGSLNMSTPIIGRTNDYYYNNQFNNTLYIADGKLYAYEDDYSQETSRPLFQIIDIDSLDTLFTGTVEVKDTSEGSFYDVYVNDLMISTSEN